MWDCWIWFWTWFFSSYGKLNLLHDFGKELCWFFEQIYLLFVYLCWGTATSNVGCLDLYVYIYIHVLLLERTLQQHRKDDARCFIQKSPCSSCIVPNADARLEWNLMHFGGIVKVRFSGWHLFLGVHCGFLSLYTYIYIDIYVYVYVTVLIISITHIYVYM